LSFVETLEAKAVLELAKADLAYYDNIIKISRDRFRAGDIAKIDLDRIELLRVNMKWRYRQPSSICALEDPASATAERRTPWSSSM